MSLPRISSYLSQLDDADRLAHLLELFEYELRDVAESLVEVANLCVEPERVTEVVEDLGRVALSLRALGGSLP